MEQEDDEMNEMLQQTPLCASSYIVYTAGSYRIPWYSLQVIYSRQILVHCTDHRTRYCCMCTLYACRILTVLWNTNPHCERTLQKLYGIQYLYTPGAVRLQTAVFFPLCCVGLCAVCCVHVFKESHSALFSVRTLQCMGLHMCCVYSCICGQDI